MIIREAYTKTEDFKKSIEIIKNFIKENLGGDIEKFKDFDLYIGKFNNCKYYVGKIKDPDMYLITQAIYIVLWGHIWNLNFENLGSWGRSTENQFPFRGDTIHACGKFGDKNDRVTNFFNIDKKDLELFNDILQFEKSYHRIGNFIVLPNRGNINCNKADWLNGMRDYFDWFLISIYNYQQRENGNEDNVIREFDNAFKSREKFDELLKQNEGYSKDYLSISEWKDVFFLDECFDNGVPVNYFNLDPEFRMKITAAETDRGDLSKYYTDKEYTELLRIYVDKSNDFINKRTQRMIEKLKEIIEKN